jgi:hypothetical protein
MKTMNINGAPILSLDDDPRVETKEIEVTYTVNFKKDFTWLDVAYPAGENTFTVRINVDFVDNRLHDDDLFDAVYDDYGHRFFIYKRIKGLAPPLDVDFPDPIIKAWRAAQ